MSRRQSVVQRGVPYTEKQLSEIAKLTVSPIEEVVSRVKAGDKFCRGCRRWLAVATEWAPHSKTRDKLRTICRNCERAANTTRYNEAANGIASGAAMVPLELLPVVKPDESIGCLNCRHAQVSLLTEFEGAKMGGAVTVHCAKAESNVRLQWTACPKADPRPSKPRHLMKYWRRYGPIGDRIAESSPILLLFLKHCWTTWAKDDLLAVTLRTEDALRHLVRSNAIGGAKVGKSRLAQRDTAAAQRAVGRASFTRGQSEWLLGVYATAWPEPLHRLDAPERRSRIMADRERILNRLAALGPRWTWEQACQHLERKQRRANGHRRKGGQRKVNQFMVATVAEGGETILPTMQPSK